MGPGGELHLQFLEVVAGARELVEAADMVVVHMGDDDVLDRRRVDADHRQPLGGGAQQGAPAARCVLLGEAGIDDVAALGADHRPDVVVDRHRRVVVGVEGDEIAAAPAFRQRRVLDRKHLVLVAHGRLLGHPPPAILARAGPERKGPR